MQVVSICHSVFILWFLFIKGEYTFLFHVFFAPYALVFTKENYDRFKFPFSFSLHVGHRIRILRRHDEGIYENYFLIKFLALKTCICMINFIVASIETIATNAQSVNFSSLGLQAFVTLRSIQLIHIIIPKIYSVLF